MNQVVCTHCQHPHPITGKIPVGRKAVCKNCRQQFVVFDPMQPPVQTETENDFLEHQNVVAEPEPEPVPISPPPRTFTIEPKTDERSEMQSINSTLIEIKKSLQPSNDNFMVGFRWFFLVVASFVFVAFIGSISQVSFYQQRFKDDNAVGATANALEEIARDSSMQTALLGWCAFLLFIIATRPKNM